MQDQLLGNRYRIKELLGEGGMAAVYVAIDEKLGRRVAVKILHSHLAQNDDIRQRFQMEARAISGIEHPNIVKIYDYSGSQSETLWIVVEILRGKNLAQYAKGFPGCQIHAFVAAMMVREVCKALHEAHSHGIVHRDIKPENIMALDTGRIKLMDFGIAKDLHRSNLTITGTFMGSPSYMSPEQIRGKDVDNRSDIYSLGVMFYEITTGILPYTGNSTAEVINKIIVGKYTPAILIQPGLPAELNDIISKAMHGDPEQRFPNVGAMGIFLDQFLARHALEESHVELERLFQDPTAYFDRLKNTGYENAPHTSLIDREKSMAAISRMTTRERRGKNAEHPQAGTNAGFKDGSEGTRLARSITPAARAANKPTRQEASIHNKTRDTSKPTRQDAQHGSQRTDASKSAFNAMPKPGHYPSLASHGQSIWANRARTTKEGGPAHYARANTDMASGRALPPLPQQRPPTRPPRRPSIDERQKSLGPIPPPPIRPMPPAPVAAVPRVVARQRAKAPRRDAPAAPRRRVFVARPAYLRENTAALRLWGVILLTMILLCLAWGFKAFQDSWQRYEARYGQQQPNHTNKTATQEHHKAGKNPARKPLKLATVERVEDSPTWLAPRTSSNKTNKDAATPTPSPTASATSAPGNMVQPNPSKTKASTPVITSEPVTAAGNRPISVGKGQNIGPSSKSKMTSNSSKTAPPKPVEPQASAKDTNKAAIPTTTPKAPQASRVIEVENIAASSAADKTMPTSDSEARTDDAASNDKAEKTEKNSKAPRIKEDSKTQQGTGLLMVTAEPAAEILVDGVPKGSSNDPSLANGMMIKAGERLVELRRRDYQTRREKVSVKAGETTRLQLRLERANAGLTLTLRATDVPYELTMETIGSSGSTRTQTITQKRHVLTLERGQYRLKLSYGNKTIERVVIMTPELGAITFTADFTEKGKE